MSTDFANFSQSLTPALPRGHRGPSSSCETDPGYVQIEMSLLQSSCPIQPTRSFQAAPKWHLNFQENAGIKQGRLLYLFNKLSLPGSLPLHPITPPSAPSEAQSRTRPTCSPAPSHNTLLSKGFTSQLSFSLHQRRLKEVNTAFGMGSCCHCLVPAKVSHRETSQSGEFLGPQLLATSRWLCTKTYPKTGQSTSCSC